MLRIKVKDRAVRALIGHLAFTGNRATAGLRRAVLRQTMKVQAAAQKLTPADGDVSLRRSAQSDVTMLGDSKLLATVTFGGLAEALDEDAAETAGTAGCTAGCNVLNCLHEALLMRIAFLTGTPLDIARGSGTSCTLRPGCSSISEPR